MTNRLQKTGHRESLYERPNQKWVCGWAAEGNPCPVGPDRAGHCTAQAQSQCSPRKQGDRWSCARLPGFGGPCDSGPLPDGKCCRPTPSHPVCQPRLSLRARRSRVVWTGVALTVGLLALQIGGPWSSSFVSPGDLTSAHATIAGPHGTTPDCAACHRAEQPGDSRWIRSVFSSGSNAGDSGRCLRCHFDKDEDALFVHGQPPEQLAAVTELSKQRAAESGEDQGAGTPLLALASLAGAPPASSSGRIACATCHSEHRGREVSLTRLDDNRCQACHTSRFASFADGHPEFTIPAAPPAGINFDHATHQQANFGEQDFACSRCHTPDAQGRTMLLYPFAQACAGCHHQGETDHHAQRNIKASALDLLQLPGMEFEEPPSYWPEEAAVGGPLTPLVLLLLSGDAAALEALESLDAEGLEWEPYDWWPEDDQTKHDLALAIKRAVHDLAAGPRSALAGRLAAALGADRDDPAVIALLDQLEPAQLAIAAYVGRYLPELANDVAAGNAEGSPPGSDAPSWELPAADAGWHVSEGEASVAYKPASHADPLLKAWIDALAANAGTGGEESPSFVQRLRARAFEDAASSGFFYKACLRCHTTSPAGSGPGRVHWNAAGHAAKSGGYTKFNHGPHLTLKSACDDCHEIAVTVEGEPERPKVRGLFAHRKSQCVTCHTPQQARSDCLACHDYHLRRSRLASIDTASLGRKLEH